MPGSAVKRLTSLELPTLLLSSPPYFYFLAFPQNVLFFILIPTCTLSCFSSLNGIFWKSCYITSLHQHVLELMFFLLSTLLLFPYCLSCFIDVLCTVKNLHQKHMFGIGEKNKYVCESLFSPIQGFKNHLPAHQWSIKLTLVQVFFWEPEAAFSQHYGILIITGNCKH